MIHKKKKEPQEVGSSRPVSLLNQDGKLSSKLLANRLSPFLDKAVHPEQTGFIAGRNSSFNLRRLFNIMCAADRPKEERAVLSLHAHKAFHLIEWPYLFDI